MYSMRQAEPDRWSVIDSDDVQVFVGTLLECEDWLDHEENVSNPRVSLVKSFVRRLGRLFSRNDRSEPKSKEPEHLAEDDSPSKETKETSSAERTADDPRIPSRSSESP